MIFIGQTFEVKFIFFVVCKEDKLYVFGKEKVTWMDGWMNGCMSSKINR